MKVVIDTSSLISLVRYYIRFDSESKLYNLFRKKIETGEIVIIAEVLSECKYTTKGIVIKDLKYLINQKWKKEYGVPINTNEIFPPSPKKFHNMVDNQLINRSAINKISTEEYAAMKETFMNSADCRMIIYCLDHMNTIPDEKIFIVTEETITPNDTKAFKKIPAIGKLLDIDVINLPTLISWYPDIKISF